jgi:undecaprenyl-diphosphatase
MHWQDQGLLTDVMVHMGSLLAILIYFWRDVWNMLIGIGNLLRGKVTQDGKLALYILIATIPAVLFGLFVKKTGLIDRIRGPEIVAYNAIFYGLLMYVADRLGKSIKTVENITLFSAFFIGIAQALAIIPGTSRSGITITAARSLGYTRPEAARFSFLLGIPAIAGAGILVIGEAIAEKATISSEAILTGVLTLFTAWAAIAFMMAILKRYTLTCFVVYRVLLGLLLLYLLHTGWLQKG